MDASAAAGGGTAVKVRRHSARSTKEQREATSSGQSQLVEFCDHVRWTQGHAIGLEEVKSMRLAYRESRKPATELGHRLSLCRWTGAARRRTRRIREPRAGLGTCSSVMFYNYYSLMRLRESPLPLKLMCFPPHPLELLLPGPGPPPYPEELFEPCGGVIHAPAATPRDYHTRYTHTSGGAGHSKCQQHMNNTTHNHNSTMEAKSHASTISALANMANTSHDAHGIQT